MFLCLLGKSSDDADVNPWLRTTYLSKWSNGHYLSHRSEGAIKRLNLRSENKSEDGRLNTWEKLLSYPELLWIPMFYPALRRMGNRRYLNTEFFRNWSFLSLLHGTVRSKRTAIISGLPLSPQCLAKTDREGTQMVITWVMLSFNVVH